MSKKAAMHAKAFEKKETKAAEKKKFPFFDKKEKKAGVERPTKFKFGSKLKGK